VRLDRRAGLVLLAPPPPLGPRRALAVDVVLLVAPDDKVLELVLRVRRVLVAVRATALLAVRGAAGARGAGCCCRRAKELGGELVGVATGNTVVRAPLVVVVLDPFQPLYRPAKEPASVLLDYFLIIYF
jgi:hypothetical protein